MNSVQQAVSRRSHRLTRLGFHFLFVGAFAMLGGALRGFNLLLILAGLLVGALIMQWRWSRRSVESLTVTRRLPTEAFAGTPFRVRYRLHNHGRLMPVWMIRVEDRIEQVDGRDKALAACGVGVISPGQTVVPYCDCLIRRRGRYRFSRIALMTTFPFSLFVSRQVVDDRCELYLFPSLLTLRGRWQQRLVSRSGGVATTARRSGPVEGDFFGLREWQRGDSPKWIHWRTTARLSEPAVRQFEQQRRFDTCILVDAFCDSGGKSITNAAGSNREPTNDQSLVELAISLAATLVVHMAGSPSNRVILAVAGRIPEVVIGGGSSEGKRRMLETLADVAPTAEPLVDQAARDGIHLVGQTQDLLVVSPRSFRQVKQSEPGVSKTFASWMRRGSFRWIDVGDPAIDRWIMRDSVAMLKARRDDGDKVNVTELTEAG